MGFWAKFAKFVGDQLNKVPGKTRSIWTFLGPVSFFTLLEFLIFRYGVVIGFFQVLAVSTDVPTKVLELPDWQRYFFSILLSLMVVVVMWTLFALPKFNSLLKAFGIDDNTPNKVILTVAAVISFPMIAVIKYGSLLFFFYLFPKLGMRISNVTGVSIWMSYLISMLPTLVLAYSLAYVLSPDLKKRRLGGIGLFSALISFILFMYFATGWKVCDSEAGVCSPCIARGSSGYFEPISCHETTHPQTGQVVIKDAKKARQLLLAQSRDQYNLPTVSRVIPQPDTQFFDIDGNPLLWYYQHKSGKLEFFDGPGIHPVYGQPLVPVTSSIAEQVISMYENGTAGSMIIKRGYNSHQIKQKNTAKRTNSKGVSEVDDLVDYLKKRHKSTEELKAQF